MKQKKTILIIMTLVTIIIILFFFLLAFKVFKVDTNYIIGKTIIFEDETISEVIKDEIKKETLKLSERKIKARNHKESFVNFSFYDFSIYDAEDNLIDNLLIVYNELDNNIIEFADFFLEGKLELALEIINSEYQNKIKVLDMEDDNDLSLDNIRKQSYRFDARGLKIWLSELELELSFRQLSNVIDFAVFEIDKAELLKVQAPLKRDLTKYKEKNLIAFTFDDGPSEETLKLIEYAKQRDVKFTFFVLGSRVLDHKETIKDAYENAHQICNHSYSHTSFNRLNPEAVMNEISKTNELVAAEILSEINCYRSPYGNLPAYYRNIINMPEIRWNIDPEDWKYKDSEKLFEHILNHAHDGAIIVLHDLYPTTIEGSIKAIEELLNRNYAIVTIDEMAEIKGIELKKNLSYFNLK